MATCIHCGETLEGGSTSEQPICVNCRSSFAFPPTRAVPTAEPTPAPTPSFDPYHKWLGIPPVKQPPNHYQLLGLAPLETNQDVIATAARRQSSHLRSFLGEPQARDAERLMAEVDAARNCLLNEHTKLAYDGVLGPVVRAQSLSAAPTARASAQSAPALLPANSVSTDTAYSSSLVDAAGGTSDPATATQRSDASPVRRRRAMPQRSPAMQVAQIVIGGIAGCTIGYYLGFVLLPSIRARSAESRSQPPAELIIRQSPKRSSNQSQ